MLIEDLLIVARTFSRITNRALATTSSLVMDDGKCLPLIEKGARSITVLRYERTMRWFSDNWPAGHKWPNGVERPGDVHANS